MRIGKAIWRRLLEGDIVDAFSPRCIRLKDKNGNTTTALTEGEFRWLKSKFLRSLSRGRFVLDRRLVRGAHGNFNVKKLYKQQNKRKP